MAIEWDFFHRLERSAFTNPFSAERLEADRRVAGADAGASFDAVLRDVLAETDRRLMALEPFTLADFSSAEAESLTVALLFRLYHRCLADFDRLILEQLRSGDEPCAAPFAVEAFNELLRYGIGRTEAARYIAIFYQLRRAFYFIDRSLVGESPCMKQLRRRLWENLFTWDARRYVRALWDRMEDFSTLLLGETGTGKGAAAAAIGRSGFIPFNPSAGRFTESFTRAFVEINLSQYPETLIESELFGHRKGAFTGAVERHDGLFSRCSPHGAIFLDEIGEVGASVQIKLLQVLQQRTFSPVGSHEAVRFGGRVIAATNRSLDALRRTRAFRDDFYYRLCSDQITLPPLRQRLRETPSEMEALVRHILQRLGGESWQELCDPVLDGLRNTVPRSYDWPGNVRELEQAVRRILLTGRYEGDTLGRAEERSADLAAEVEAGALTVRELTAAYCKRLYSRHGSYGEVAKRTGLDWRTVKSNILSDH